MLASEDIASLKSIDSFVSLGNCVVDSMELQGEIYVWSASETRVGDHMIPGRACQPGFPL